MIISIAPESEVFYSILVNNTLLQKCSHFHEVTTECKLVLCVLDIELLYILHQGLANVPLHLCHSCHPSCISLNPLLGVRADLLSDLCLHGQTSWDLLFSTALSRPSRSLSAFQPPSALLSVVFITPDPSLVISHLAEQAHNWSWLGHFSCWGDALQLQSSAYWSRHTPDGETRHITLTCPLFHQHSLALALSLSNLIFQNHILWDCSEGLRLADMSLNLYELIQEYPTNIVILNVNLC